MMQGLGNVGQAPRQEEPQEELFTMETAGRINEGIISKMGQDASARKKSQKPVQGLGRIDSGAIEAVKRGVVDPREVMQDPKVSEQAKRVVAQNVGLV